MQTAANISLVLTDCSSFKRVADSEAVVRYGGFYQQLASELVKLISSGRVWRDLGERLVILAEHTHAFRHMDALEQVSQFLMNSPVPRQYKAVGQCYQALCIQRFGRGDLRQAARLLEAAAEDAPPRYRVRAMQSLGSNSIRQGDYRTALSLYREAARFASRSNIHDSYATLGTQKMLAVLNSEDGNHPGAVALLENLLPLANSMRSWQPHVYHDYMNSLAVELCEVGRLEEASNISRIVLASPFARAYPEWRETSNEIALRGRRPSRATVAFSQRASEAQHLRPARRERPTDDAAVSERTVNANNVVRLSVPERGHSLAQPSAPCGPGLVLSMQEWNKKKMAKDSNDTHLNDKPIDEMDGKEMLLKIMAITGSRERTDEELYRILDAIVRVMSEPKDKGKQ